jgi:2-methylcitrate dehydratase PrpD
VSDATTPEDASPILVDFCSGIRWPSLPDAVRQRTLDLILDLVGVMLAGSASETAASAARYARRDPGARGGALVIGAGFAAPAPTAALANGVAAHALELDDVARVSSLHPGAVVIPAALAVAEDEAATPIQLLEAIVAGYEVVLRVGNALGAESAYRRGFHPTGVAGVFGAALASGLLLRLSRAELVHALGIAGTMAAGSLEYLSDGSWTKRLNPGWAAHAGIVAAQLAKAGFTGPSSVFEGRLGVLHAYTDAPVPGRLLDGLGDELQVMTVAIKPYACCRYNHGLIDAMLELRADARLDLEQVTRIRLGVLTAGSLLVSEPIEQKRRPASVVDAQFSAPFAAAVALLRGAAGPDEYTTEVIADESLRALLQKVDCVADPLLDQRYPTVWPAWAEVHLGGGLVLRRDIDYALGEPENPVSRLALLAKFNGLTAVHGERRDRVVQALLDIESAESIGPLLDALRGCTEPLRRTDDRPGKHSARAHGQTSWS